MTLVSNMKVILNVQQTKTLSLAQGSVPVTKVYETAYTDGTGAGKADLVFHTTRTLAGATDPLDLAGALTDAFGSTLTFVKIKSITISAPATNAANIVVGNGASNQFQGPFGAVAHTIAVKPGGKFHIDVGATDLGWSVVAATGDILGIAGTSGDKYDVIIVGASA
jgi:hypothetical protein